MLSELPSPHPEIKYVGDGKAEYGVGDRVVDDHVTISSSGGPNGGGLLKIPRGEVLDWVIKQLQAAQAAATAGKGAT